jgi:DHA1 family bicyclomycin/chloramphenicol resistance-like MFS transporter
MADLPDHSPSEGTFLSLSDGKTGFSFGAFIAFAAAVMALNGLSIDSMLPSLPAIGDALGVAQENQRQWIIGAFLIGFGASQIVWGPLADRYGRKPILVVSMVLYTLFCLAAGLATSFPMLLTARFFQGVAASTSRVILVSVVRDCYSGRRMARVMSLAFMIFLIVPVLAPSVGQIVVLMFGSWRSLFFTLAFYGAVIAAITAARLNETLHPEYRRPLTFGTVSTAFLRVILHRSAIGYTFAAAFAFGCISGFIMSVEQIFMDIFHVPKLFPILFAGIAGSMAFAAFFNSRFVERLGTRRISHAALLGFLAIGATHLGVALAGLETIYSFVALQTLQMIFFGLLGANFNSMAMEPVGDIAGSASSVQGFLSTCIGAGIGALIGQSFDGTTVPLAFGFTGCGLAALGAVLFAERGKLFRPQHAVPAAQ